MKALSEIAANTTEPPELRASALRLLQRGSTHGSVFPAAVAAFAPLAGHDIGQPALTAAFEDFTRDAKNAKWLGDFAKALARAATPRKRALAATVLVNLATSNLVKGKEHDAALAAVEKGWAKPESAAALLGAIARTKAKAFAEPGGCAPQRSEQRRRGSRAFRPPGARPRSSRRRAAESRSAQMKYEEVFAAVQKGGDVKAGQEMFLRAGCIACHTVDAERAAERPDPQRRRENLRPRRAHRIDPQAEREDRAGLRDARGSRRRRATRSKAS